MTNEDEMLNEKHGSEDLHDIENVWKTGGNEIDFSMECVYGPPTDEWDDYESIWEDSLSEQSLDFPEGEDND